MEKKETHLFTRISYFVLTILTLIHLPEQSIGQATCNVSGNWSNAANWTPAAPSAGQTVTIPAGVTVNVDVNTVNISDLIINGTLIINSDAISDLNINGNVSINGSGILENNGGIH